MSSTTFTSPITTPEEQLQFELAQHQQQLAQLQAAQAAEISQLAIQSTPNPVKAQANLDIQRQLLQQKLAEKEISCLASPTDSMMSPCSKKLQQQKQRNFGKQKPRLLTQAFAQAAEKNKENTKSLLGSTKPKTPIPTDEPIF